MPLIRHLIQTKSLLSVPLLIYAGCWLVFPKPLVLDPGQFLPLHLAMECFSVVVCCMIFGIAWNTYDADRPRNIFVLGAGFLAVGLLDFAHLMSYQGMPDFVTPSSPQKAIVFWLAARIAAAAAMLVAAKISWRPLSVSQVRKRGLAMVLCFTVLMYWVELWHPQWMPLFWREGEGLTTAKLFLEYLLIGLYVFAALFIYLKARQTNDYFNVRGLYLAAGVMAVSELCFSSYESVTDVFNFLGHIFKVIAYLFLYRVLFLQLVRTPYLKLEQSRHEIWLEKERAEVTLQSIMDAVITTDADGRITSMNPVASQLAGWSESAAKGKPLAHIVSIIDETDSSPIENPVEQCLREKRAVLLSNHAMIVSAFGYACAIEQLASPIVNREGAIVGVVMVFRDVTERRRAHELILSNEQRLTEAQSIAKLGNWDWDLIDDRVIASEEMFRLMGWRHNVQPSYATFLNALHPADKDFVISAVEAALAGDRPYNCEYRVVHDDGRVLHLHARGEVHGDQNGKAIRMVGTALDITERKLASEQLQAYLQEIEDLYQHAPCGYHSLDSEGIIVRINQTELDWLGYSHDEVVGKMAFTDFLSDDSVAVFHENYPRFKEHGVINDLEFELVRKEGSRFFVSLSGTAIYDDNGCYLVSRSTMYDISERRKAQLALVRKEESLRRAQAIAHVGSWEWEIIGGQQNWSDETFRIFGLSPGQCSPSYDIFMDLVLPEDRRALLNNVQTALYGQTPYYTEFRIKRPDGEIRHVLAQAELIRDALGKPLRMIGTNLDVTELKLAEYELMAKAAEQRRQAEIQSAILDALPANLALIDAEGVIVAVNRRWRDFAEQNSVIPDQLGVGSNYLQACNTFVDQDDAVGVTLSGLRSVLVGNSGQFVVEYPCHSPEQQRWFRMLAVPLSNREQIGAVVIHIDITESWQHKSEIELLNQQLELRVVERTSQLEAANKELEAFSYSVSHDLRAPLRVIDGFAHMLSADYGSLMAEDARQHLDHILIATQRMGELIEDLLQLSQVSRSDLRLERVDLSGMVENILTSLHHVEPDRKGRFSVAPNLTVTCDAHLLQIAMENLLTNAWKFTRTRAVAEISFGVMQNGETATYFVRDNGVGFNDKYAHKLFGAFQRLHAEDEFEGTGIGLATVQRIISRHGGRVWAESSLGVGATFFFSIC